MPLLYIVRHGETAWSLTGQHTGRADIPLTPRGEEHARLLAPRLKRIAFASVFVSPLQRATRTCELAGYKSVAEVDANLYEWDYGKYEGRLAVDIRAERPDWDLFRDGCPGGELPEQVGVRADAVLERVRPIEGNVLIFSSGHLLRVLGARWLTLPSGGARYFHLDTASLSILGFEHGTRPVIQRWNDQSHLETGK
jgi:broad specificity phosphatase PhoE